MPDFDRRSLEYERGGPQTDVPPVVPPDPAAESDRWVALEDPAEVESGTVPGIVRLDEARVGKSSFSEATACLIDDDGRRALREMLARPNRWVCKIQVAFRDLSAVSFGSGLLIGDRFVLTAAHVLMEPVRGSDGRFERAADAAAVVVIPGLNGRGRRLIGAQASDTMPFGWTHGTAFRASRVFRMAMRASGSQPRDLDYALIQLATPIGAARFAVLGNAPLGFWGYPAHGGQTRIRPKAANTLKGVKVNAVGYPLDKCTDRPEGRTITEDEYNACRTADLGSVPWYSFDRIVSVGSGPFAALELNNDAAPGMSGGPVWLRWQTVRNLIGVLHACDPVKSEDSPFVGAIAARITDAVKRYLDAWMAEGA